MRRVSSKFLESADVVIAGGGVMGCALAHHLAKRKVDVMLLERETLRRAGDAVGRTERAAEHVVLAAVPELEGFWCAAGFSGHGSCRPRRRRCSLVYERNAI